jgi:hypothetical protein
VNAHVYLFESRRDAERTKAQARTTAFELARILAPLFGGEVKDDDDGESSRSTCDHTFGEGGMCVLCGLRVKDGVMSYGPEPVECVAHSVVNGQCVKCGGHEFGDEFVTKGSPRIV